AKHVIARRAEFARKLAPLRLVPIEHDDFELSTGGPLSHNFFIDIALETEPLFRPRYNAFALGSADPGASWTLESLWTEAVGSPPGGDVAKWPQS
ncbi:MAG: hypothetical protein K2Q20_14455, partial [Phycisphaerales bacterium]|nr:hypothetical protein [Phycisphaerales bacterium]